MLQSPPPQSGISLLLIEGSLTLLAVAVSFAWPRLGNTTFSRIEQAFAHLARRRRLAVLVVGMSELLLRLALLPLIPIPLPFIPDDFSFLLMTDTFVHGRLANPTPAMWVHFESIHITMQPTYASMYFPGVGLVLALGKVLFGHPWCGLLITTALMCAAICWMLQAWLPPNWALLGGFLAVLRIGLFSYWINTYTGGGSLAALGGALLLGALPRFLRSASQRHAMIMAVGVVFLAYTRPYEGLLLCLPVAVVLGHWLLRARNRPAMSVLFRRIAAPLALIVAAGAWLGYYDYRVFGSPMTLPYKVDRTTYALAPYFIWQKPHAEPSYRHVELRRFYEEELANFEEYSSYEGIVQRVLLKLLSTGLFYAGFALFPLLIMLPRAFLDRRIRFLVYCLFPLGIGEIIEAFLSPHYIAPFIVIFYAVALQAGRHLWYWKIKGARIGRTVVRMCATVCIFMAGLRPFNHQLHIYMADSVSAWEISWYGPDRMGIQRDVVTRELERQAGEQLALVRYTAGHDPGYDWVYNSADIDNSKVIWAREMDAACNRELIQYYNDRKVWLVQPDQQPAAISPYPVTELVNAASQSTHCLP